MRIFFSFELHIYHNIKLTWEFNQTEIWLDTKILRKRETKNFKTFRTITASPLISYPLISSTAYLVTFSNPQLHLLLKFWIRIFRHPHIPSFWPRSENWRDNRVWLYPPLSLHISQLGPCGEALQGWWVCDRLPKENIKQSNMVYLLFK